MKDDKQHCILMVDDDSDYRESMRRLLWTVKESFPVRVLEASEGAQAKDILQREHVDCVLLDRHMPGGSGVDWIAEFLKADTHLPIVMVTGQGDEATAVSAMKQGAMDYLVKGSISAEALQRAVTNAVEKMALRRTLAKQRETLLMAERHRGMIESLGSACHHLGQPMSVVTVCLDIMKRQSWGPSVQALVDKCEAAVESVNEILTKLQRVSVYRTEPYLPASEGEKPRSDERILSICGGDEDRPEQEPGKNGKNSDDAPKAPTDASEVS